MASDLRATERRLPEATRIARVLDIIWRISAAPRYWTRKRLADEFEVSERMITADLEIIRHRLRFDLRNERGSGYYFVALPQLPSVTYSAPEALALVLAAEAGRQNPGIPQADLSSAIARLVSVIPAELRLMVRRFADNGQAGGDDLVQARAHTHRQRMLALCSEAALARRSLVIVYSAASRGGEETRRRVDPYAVFPYNRSWQLVGYCHLREALRMFKIDRIQAATPLTDAFAPAADFDLGAFLNGGWGVMRGLDAPVEDVTLRFSPRAAAWIADEAWHPSQRLERASDGSLIFRVTIQQTPEFQRWVLHYGREVEALEPESLRAWLRDEALATLAVLDHTAPC
jgi:predicted DNA-binding transcriptional regulator YafY